MSKNRGNTKMCSVLFVDIVGYSKKTNSEQMALKQQFVSLWGQAIKEVPPGEIMVVDAGDGAALTALVEPEDTIRVAMKLRELLQLEEEKSGEPLPLRIGIHFGPVQLSTDVHGNPCVVGDAINTAQRIMSFADPGQIMISRSYFDVIDHLSNKYKEIFIYLGKREDKHVREHEVFGLCAPNQAASMGQAAVGGLSQVSKMDTEDVKPEILSATPPAQTLLPVNSAPDAQAAPPSLKPPRSLPGRFWSWFLSISKSIFFIFKLAMLVLVIYELAMLIPVIKQPDQVKAELNSQIESVKEAWSGLLMVEETLKPLADELGNQPVAASQTAASQPPGTHAGKAGAVNSKAHINK